MTRLKGVAILLNRANNLSSAVLNSSPSNSSSSLCSDKHGHLITAYSYKIWASVMHLHQHFITYGQNSIAGRLWFTSEIVKPGGVLLHVLVGDDVLVDLVHLVLDAVHGVMVLPQLPP